jgi:hypothetical protein
MNNRSLPFRLSLSTIQHNQQFLIRWGIIAGVLALSAYLGRNATDRYLMIIAGVFGALILMRWMKIGLPILLVASLIVPFGLDTGSQTQLNVTVILVPALLGVWVADMVRRRRVYIVSSSTTLPMFAFALAVTFSLIAGNFPWNYFAHPAPLVTQIAAWAVFIFSIGAFFLVANQITDPRGLMLLVVLFIVIGGLYMIGRLGIPPFSQLSTQMNRIAADGSMFWTWLTALATGQVLFNRRLPRGAHIALLGLIALTVYIGFFLARDWASGWAPPLIAIGVIVWLRSWRVGMVLGIVGAIAIFFLNPNLLNNLLASAIGVESYSISTRDAARQILVEQIFPLSPVFGLGPANYYFYTPLYPILGWHVNFNSHNNYVDILVQTGALGFACFLWIFVQVGWLGWRLREKFTGDFAQGYINGCLGGIAATLVAAWLADWVIPFAYNIGLRGFRASILAWIFMGGLVALEQIARRSSSADAK